MTEINQIISLAKHCLHLCNNSNIEEIIFPYLIGDVNTFVTNNIETWKKIFDENGIKCQVKKPDEIKKNEKIVVDGSSLGNEFKKWEKKWEKQNKTICVYNIDKLDPLILKPLVDIHNKMFLSVNKIRMFSDKMIEEEVNLNPEIVENIVKRDLKNIIISLLLSKPMCGTELVKIVYQRFKVFISPGMLYPTLHELEKNGLLKYEYKLKNKIYTIQEKEQAKLLLKNHVKVNSLLSQFLVSN